MSYDPLPIYKCSRCNHDVYDHLWGPKAYGHCMKKKCRCLKYKGDDGLTQAKGVTGEQHG